MAKIGICDLGRTYVQKKLLSLAITCTGIVLALKTFDKSELSSLLYNSGQFASFSSF